VTNDRTIEFAGGVIKIAHSMALKNIPYLFVPVYLVSGFRCQVSGVRFQVSGFRCQVSAPLFIIPDT